MFFLAIVVCSGGQTLGFYKALWANLGCNRAGNEVVVGLSVGFLTNLDSLERFPKIA